MKNVVLRKCLLTALLASFALISFIIENLIPPLFLPGARLGISNVFILLALIILGDSWAFAVLIVKIVLGSVFSGNISAIMYSLPSGIIALSVEVLLVHFAKRFGLVAVSVTGAVINILVQNVVFCLVTASYQYLLYSPYLALIGVLGGLIVGFAVYLVVRFLPIKILKPFGVNCQQPKTRREQTENKEEQSD